MMFCASIVHPTGLHRFYPGYVADRHVPGSAALLGGNRAGYEVHQPLAEPGAPAPPFSAAAYVWVRSAEEAAADGRSGSRRRQRC